MINSISIRLRQRAFFESQRVQRTASMASSSNHVSSSDSLSSDAQKPAEAAPPASPSISSSLFQRATPERAIELAQNLDEIRERVRKQASSRRASSGAGFLATEEPLLVAVSKYKPASDVMACYEHGQRDFGENYVQELVDKAKELPQDIRWHFIGTLQTNKAKALTAIPNLYAVQTLSSVKAADALNRALPPGREVGPLNVLLQVNTSGEDSKSGLPPPSVSSNLSEQPGTGDESSVAHTDMNNNLLSEDTVAESELGKVAEHIVLRCPRLHLQGLMTIGALSESLGDGDENRDFEALKKTRNTLEMLLRGKHAEDKWGVDGRLLLSMGMSSDFEAAVMSGSGIVRVGTGIFGQRHKKGES